MPTEGEILEGAVNMHTASRRSDEKTYKAMLENHRAEQTTYPALMKHMQLPPPTSTVSSALSPPTFDACPSLFS
ncbi:hypothetical protein OE88DRAFT_1654704 [Heliocybe sulcata]|uniref:Uncharacterized protein n=1 Tax=Heliocybe sulcata TaxID=5364 RepID=A0A5C3N9Z5_9AGAM|nr:hypothetical protein OE88DRAFT_1654704 [Heliocybe sulcata]